MPKFILPQGDIIIFIEYRFVLSEQIIWRILKYLMELILFQFQAFYSTIYIKKLYNLLKINLVNVYEDK